MNFQEPPRRGQGRPKICQDCFRNCCCYLCSRQRHMQSVGESNEQKKERKKNNLIWTEKRVREIGVRF